ncbi:MAG: hypothetical protein KGJ92_00715 [Actinomycetales bacterium]|nr:hypothetical protein [Actinomycetales bacterium]
MPVVTRSTSRPLRRDAPVNLERIHGVNWRVLARQWADFAMEVVAPEPGCGVGTI